MIKQSQDDLRKHLKEQLEFLNQSSELYDKGVFSEAKRLACTITTLVHDKGRNISLLSQLKYKNNLGALEPSEYPLKNNLYYYDTGTQYDKFMETCSHIMATGKWKGGFVDSQRLVILASMEGEPALYKPKLYEGLKVANKIPFDKWWNQIVIKDSKNNTFSRCDIVLSMRDKDGGAHIDPELGKEYGELTRNGSADLTLLINDKIVLEHGPEHGTVRQIAFELEKSLHDQIKI